MLNFSRRVDSSTEARRAVTRYKNLLLTDTLGLLSAKFHYTDTDRTGHDQIIRGLVGDPGRSLCNS